MATTITCLLVTNDPDDFLEFSEALNEISKDAILVAVADTARAITLLVDKLQTPDFIFLNLSMYGGRPESFLKQVKENKKLSKVCVVGYGDSVSLNGTKSHVSHFLNDNFSYTDLKKFLIRLLNS